MGESSLFTAVAEGSTLIVAPTGPISNVAGHEIQPEVDRLVALLQNDQLRNVVVDMEHLPVFGTVVLGAVNSLWKQIRPRQGRLVFCNLSEVGREVVRVARLDTLWPAYPSRQQALQSLAQ
jgi:anti-anti-sigma factor